MTLPIHMQIPVACTLSAADQTTREAEINQLFHQALRVEEEPDGYTLIFPAAASWPQILLDFIMVERACCTFFTFTLTFPSPHAEIWLSLRGTEGVKDVLRLDVANPLERKENTDDH